MLGKPQWGTPSWALDNNKMENEQPTWFGLVNKNKLIFVDTPGWWKGFPVFDTPEAKMR